MMRATVVLSAVISTSIALAIQSIYWLLFFMGEVQYAIMVPHFFCAVFLSKTNIYGSIVAIAVGLVLRIGAGDPLLRIPTIIKYPFYSILMASCFLSKLCACCHLWPPLLRCPTSQGFCFCPAPCRYRQISCAISKSVQT